MVAMVLQQKLQSREWVVGVGLHWRKLCCQQHNSLFCFVIHAHVRVDGSCSSQNQSSVVGCRFCKQIWTHNKISSLSARKPLCLCETGSLSVRFGSACWDCTEHATAKICPAHTMSNKTLNVIMVATRVGQGKESSGMKTENRDICGIVKSIGLNRAKLRSICICILRSRPLTMLYSRVYQPLLDHDPSFSTHNSPDCSN